MKLAPSSESSRPSSGFTLIEVLVVVAILALLITILLPALGRAREQARTSMCLAALQQIGGAVQMYATDTKSRLPGPIHPSIYRWTDDWIKLDRPDQNWFRSMLPGLVRRYMQANRANVFDQAGTCPTQERLLPRGRLDVAGITPATATRRPMMYVANTTEMYAAHAGNNKNTPEFPQVGTNPAFYFGRMNSGESYATGQWPVEGANANPRYRPKKIDVVRQPGREWMIADAWFWQINGQVTSQRAAGTWPYNSSIRYSIYDDDLKKWLVLNYPFHGASRPYSSWVFSGTNPDQAWSSPRLQDGKTNTVYFDGHAGSVRGWKGTLNPCFTERGC